MNKKIIFGLSMIVFLNGCSILKETEAKIEVVQEREEQDYADPYLE